MEDTCLSYNNPNGTIPQFSFDPPPWSKSNHRVLIDACIAPVIKALWDAGHITHSSCCGHGEYHPYLVLDKGDDVDLEGILKIIEKVDGRKFLFDQ